MTNAVVADRSPRQGRASGPRQSASTNSRTRLPVTLPVTGRRFSSDSGPQSAEIIGGDWLNPDLGRISFAEYGRSWLKERKVSQRTWEEHESI